MAKTGCSMTQLPYRNEIEQTRKYTGTHYIYSQHSKETILEVVAGSLS